MQGTRPKLRAKIPEPTYTYTDSPLSEGNGHGTGPSTHETNNKHHVLSPSTSSKENAKVQRGSPFTFSKASVP